MSKYDRSQPHFEVRTSSSPTPVPGYFTIVLNTNPYTFLGNRALDLSPAATFERGLVAITFKTLKVGAVLGALAGALRGGGMTASDAVDVQTDLSCLTVSSARPFPFQLDGDYLGETMELKFQHRPNAVNLVYPASP